MSELWAQEQGAACGRPFLHYFIRNPYFVKDRVTPCDERRTALVYIEEMLVEVMRAPLPASLKF